jgi:hypothetical protein
MAAQTRVSPHTVAHSITSGLPDMPGNLAFEGYRAEAIQFGRDRPRLRRALHFSGAELGERRPASIN